MVAVSARLLLVLLLGAGFGGGVWLLWAGLWPTEPVELQEPRLAKWWRHNRPPRPRRRAAGAVLAALAALVVTGWVVAAPIAALAAWSLPGLLGRDKEHERAVARIEAIATWTEQLRDTLAAAAGLEQALLATAATAPPSVRPQLATCAERISRGQRLPDALRELGDDLADPLGDLVVIALTSASGRQAGRLGDLLAGLAGSAREQALMRTRTASSRARIQTSVRIVVATTLTMAGALIILNRPYLAPFDTATGQLVLVLVAALFAAAFGWLRRIATFTQPARLLAVPTPEAAR
ncbi:type II secretion system F family protein [Kitasatospora sp. NBC_01287]|uniref:type II secretion system F family protein n=1 Tax=Kitasatospora sp. NBC_01287 TaxID=2903573 RepID=UPI00225BF210|nr:type II secretion system F family protein [Kitasatospora sp. NBC_01287]MCX4750572.1 type II secretion system F family protein [Kitasatospora sp. NBC_01287]